MKKVTILTAIILISNLLYSQINKIDTSFFSEALQETKMVDIYFPPGYDENPDMYYPVIYYLHGWGGDQNSIGQNLSWLQAFINDGTIDGVIMVCADNSPEPFNGSMFMNSVLWGNYEYYMIDNLINWVDSSFRTVPDRNYRSLMGQSMGGYGSFRYGILYKDKFRALASHAGEINFDMDWLESAKQQIINEIQPGPPYYYDFSTGGSFTKGSFLLSGAFSPDTNSPQTYINPQIVDYLMDENANFIDSVITKWWTFDILHLIHQLTPGDSIGIYFGCGTNDDWLLYPGHLTFKDTLDALGLSYEFYSHNGNHAMPMEFRKRAFIFLDSLMLPPTTLTGLWEITAQSTCTNLAVFPNPINNNGNISFALQDASDIQIEVFNYTGQKVLNISHEKQQEGQVSIPVDFGFLPNGSYICKITTEKSFYTTKFIKY